MMISKSMDGDYLTEVSNGTYKIYGDTADGGQSLLPHEFIESALAACMNITTRMVLDRMSLKYDGVEVKVSLERPSQEETVFKYKIDIKGDIDETVKNQIIAKVFNCPMRKILTSHIQVVESEKDTDA